MELIRTKTTASGIRNDFNEGYLPFFYHSYNPRKSFVAVPPELLEQLATKAGEIKLAEELRKQIEEAKNAKKRIIKTIKEKAKKRLAQAKKK